MTKFMFTLVISTLCGVFVGAVAAFNPMAGVYVAVAGYGLWYWLGTQPPKPAPMIVRVSEMTRTPGSRWRVDGPDSGQQFREDILEPNYLVARKLGAKLIVDLDGVQGFATSFLSEAFGTLAFKYGKTNVKDTLLLRCKDEPALIRDINNHIEELR